MKYALILGSVFLVSCSVVREDKRVVHFPYAEELVAKVQKVAVRKPASLSEVEEKSPRRTYFVTLYHQYLTFSRYLGKNETLTFCPQFHHDKIETDALTVPKVSFYKTSSVTGEGKAFFPETAFKGKFSLEDYHQGLGEELLTLCEDGVSENFYKFDNLITHYADRSSFHHSPRAMASVLKIPVFANFYLLKMLDTEKTAGFSHPEERRLIELTQTHWFPEYVREAGKRRSDILQNKMVKR